MTGHHMEGADIDNGRPQILETEADALRMIPSMNLPKDGPSYVKLLAAMKEFAQIDSLMFVSREEMNIVRIVKSMADKALEPEVRGAGS